nr:unnamed protein product [Haemonchus contortus]
MSVAVNLKTVFASTVRRLCSTAAQNARIIDEDGPDLPQRLLDCFLKLERLNDYEFRSVHLLRGRRSFSHIYGGQLVAHSLKSATETVDRALSPHSMHCYFVNAGSVLEPVHYNVDCIRDGKSFATRLVKVVQNGKILFTSQLSFQREQPSGMRHETKIEMPPGPDGLLTARELMRNCLENSKSDHMTPTEVFSAYKLAEFPPTFHRIYEARPVDQKIYQPDLDGPLHRPQYHMWIKPVLDVGTDPLMHQYMAAYISDSTMVETAILPHLARGFPMSMAFSLDHCIWFHQTKFNINEWMLWEQTSDFAGNSRTHTRARLWTQTGNLVMTAVQEGLARPVRENA